MAIYVVSVQSNLHRSDKKTGLVEYPPGLAFIFNPQQCIVYGVHHLGNNKQIMLIAQGWDDGTVEDLSALKHGEIIIFHLVRL